MSVTREASKISDSGKKQEYRRVVLSPDRTFIAFMVLTEGRSMVVVCLSERGELSELGIITQTSQEDEVLSIHWASRNLLVILTKQHDSLFLLTYSICNSGIAKVTDKKITNGILLLGAKESDQQVEVLFSVKTKLGIRFGLFDTSTEQYRLISPPLENVRFGGWHPSKGLLALNKLSNNDSNRYKGIIFEYSSVLVYSHDISELLHRQVTINDISPSGDFAITCEQGEFKQPGIYNLKNNQSNWLGEFEFDVAAMHFSSNGEYLLCGGPKEGEQIYYAINRYGKILGRVNTIEGSFLDPMFCSDPNYIIGHFEGPSIEPCICVYKVSTSEIKQVFPKKQGARKRTMCDHIWLPAGDISVPALKFNNNRSDDSRYFIYLHGGPNVHVIKTFTPLISRMCELGFTVLAPNLPGSTGYGRAYSRLIKDDWGGIDVKSVILLAEHLANHSQQKSVLYGASYGAYIALLAAGMRPDLWGSVIACSGISDLASLYAKGTPRVKNFLERHIGKLIRDKEELRNRSPIDWVKSISCLPLLLIHGVDDEYCPIEQSRDLAKDIHMLNKSPCFEYHELANYGHETGSESIFVEKIENFLLEIGFERFST